MDTIVVGRDGSPAAQAALEWATAEAERTHSELLVTYVVSSMAEWELAAAQINPDPIRDEIRRRLDDEWTASVRKAGVPYHTKLAVGRVAEGLMHAAQGSDATLIVIGMTPHGTFSELVWGTTQHELARHAVRPVVAVPATWSAR